MMEAGSCDLELRRLSLFQGRVIGSSSEQEEKHVGFMPVFST